MLYVEEGNNKLKADTERIAEKHVNVFVVAVGVCSGTQ